MEVAQIALCADLISEADLVRMVRAVVSVMAPTLGKMHRCLVVVVRGSGERKR